MSTVDASPGQVWRAARGPVAVVLLVLLAALMLAVVSGGRPSGLLDPRAVDPAGSRAVAEVLRDQGVRVDLVTTTAALREAAGPGVTVLVAFPDRLVESQVRAVRDTRADLVVVSPAKPGSFADGVTAGHPSPEGTRLPVCGLPVARRAGSADAGGAGYDITTAGGEVDGCYSSDGRPSLVQARSEGRSVTVVGNPEPFTNGRFGELGNASLVLGLLGANGRLLWYLPSLSDVPSDETTSFYGLVPDGVWWGVGQVVVAVLLLALWRARRLGPVVPEPLPVVVRAAETVEGRARLYRRGGARDRAADALRSGLRARLSPLLGLPRGAPPAAVVDAVAARTRRTAPEVGALLYGAAPPDDRALVRLADELDALEREVRRP
ncbi:MAG TPA: DUF4350 domain-containing protein [Actinomycetes bacterium]